LRKPSHPLSSIIDRDNSMVAVWDIETWRKVQNGMVPTPEDLDYVIFMMCCAYFWHHSSDPLMTVCVQHTTALPRKGISVIIECDTEREVLTAHMHVLGKMAPEFLKAFNGANFDWPLYQEKCKRERLLLEMRKCLSSLNVSAKETEETVLRWSFKSEQIKIDAETKHHSKCVAKFSGVIDADVMPIFLKMYPRMEVRKNFSLNFFLSKNGLESKEDMHFKRMFKIYERAIKLAARKQVHKVCHCRFEKLHKTDEESVFENAAKPEPCPCCIEIVPDIDCVKNPNYDPKGNEPEYTNELHSDLLHPNSLPNTPGTQKCCECGKRPRNLLDMQDVAYYCTIDCIRPQQLCNKRVIIPDKRELSTMSYVSLYDSFYRADGMKVRNLIGCFAHKNGIAFSNAKTTKSPDEKDHYPGAWVFPPTRGLNAKRPITGLDFASLYPSLMMTYNLSPDMVVDNREEAEKLAAEGYSIYHIKPFQYERGAEKGSAMNKHLTAEGWTVRHNGILNPKRDKKIITTYVKTVTYTGKVDGNDVTLTTGAEPTPDERATINKMDKPVRRVKYVGKEGRDPLPGERMGIFAFIVKKLFDRRVPIKAEFVRLSKLLEQMELAKVKIWKNADCSDITMSEVKFQIAKVDSKQRAVKVLANTFYGESGNYMSSVYELLVAAGITGAGQDNIKGVAEEITKRGFGPQYGDTDSIYTTCPDHYYADADAKFEAAMRAIDLKFNGVRKIATPETDDERAYKAERVKMRVAYWTEQVEITMKVMMALKEDVSDFLLAQNGTLFLNMAYEEVGFPTVLCGKKKYYMTPHIDVINFRPKDIFIRGIDIIKQGQTQISKKLGDEFMRESLSPENERELIDIAEDKIRKFFATKMTAEEAAGLFSLSAKYNPTKKNVPVHVFVSRMKAIQARYKSTNQALYALYEPPEAGDKFAYVIVKKEVTFTLQGSRIDVKKGDQMEFLRVYMESQRPGSGIVPMEIDMNYYVKNAIVGIFARFIAYHPKFQPEAGLYDVQDKEQYKSMDKFCIKEASRHLEQLCDSITGFDKTKLAQCGRDYRSQYKRVDKAVRRDLAVRYGDAATALTDYDLTDAENGRAKALVDQIIIEATESAQSSINKNYGNEILTRMDTATGIRAYGLRRLYKAPNVQGGMTKIATDGYRAHVDAVISELWSIAGSMSNIIWEHGQKFIGLIDDMRTREEQTLLETEVARINTLSPEDLVIVARLTTLKHRLAALYKLQAQHQLLWNAISVSQAKSIGEPMDPRINVVEVAREEASKTEAISPFAFP
jgi:DNA polymerase elongation subunit (family B)